MEKYLEEAKNCLTPDATDEDISLIESTLEDVRRVREEILNIPLDVTSDITQVVDEVSGLFTSSVDSAVKSLNDISTKIIDTVNKVNTCAENVTTKSQEAMNNMDAALSRAQSAVSAASEKSLSFFSGLCAHKNKYNQTGDPNSNRTLPVRLNVPNVKEYLEQQSGTPVLKYPQK